MKFVWNFPKWGGLHFCPQKLNLCPQQRRQMHYNNFKLSYNFWPNSTLNTLEYTYAKCLQFSLKQVVAQKTAVFH